MRSFFLLFCFAHRGVVLGDEIFSPSAVQNFDQPFHMGASIRSKSVKELLLLFSLANRARAAKVIRRARQSWRCCVSAKVVHALEVVFRDQDEREGAFWVAKPLGDLVRPAQSRTVAEKGTLGR